MGLSRRKFTKEVKVAAIQRLDAGASIAEVARAFEVNPNLLHRWRKEFRHGPGNAFPGGGKRRWEETRVAQLERKVGQQTLEIDFLKGCLQRIEEERMLQALTGKPRPAGTSKAKSRKASRWRSGECAKWVRSAVLPSIDLTRTARRPTRIWICGMRSSALLWSFLAMAGRGSPPS